MERRIAVQIFNPDSKFSQFIYSVMDYVKLGLVFLLFSFRALPPGLLPRP